MTDVAPPEAAQEGAQGAWRLDRAAQGAGRPPGAQHIGVVNAVAPSQRGGHQRHHLVARVRPPRGIAQVEALLDEFGQAEMPGQGGAGKSFSTKLGLLRGISRGIVYYVIDPEGEYASLAQTAGGRVLTPGVAGHGLNPFVLEEEDENEVLQRVGGLRRLIEVIVGERFSPEQRATLDEALTAYYTTHRAVTGFQDFFIFLESQGYKGMASLLRPFATGSLRHLLTDQGADLMGTELPITVFNLRLLEPELRPAATLVCAEAVWSMASRDPRPRVLVMDEVWSIMQHPEGASSLVSLAKRARKHHLGLISITQDVQDFLSEDTNRPIVGHSGRVLLQNSAFKLLLQQDAAALRAVGESFDLSEADVQWLLSCPRGDGMLIARGGRFPVRILAATEEQGLIDARPAVHS